jgi:hypothetical protein
MLTALYRHAYAQARARIHRRLHVALEAQSYKQRLAFVKTHDAALRRVVTDETQLAASRAALAEAMLHWPDGNDLGQAAIAALDEI